MKKQDLLAMVEQLPEQFDPERLMHDLYIKAKLERAEEAVARGEIVSQDEAERRTPKAFHSAAQGREAHPG